ncbi:MAG: hypothetical protein ABIJ11_05995 [Elusimicrobiota bacterium]
MKNSIVAMLTMLISTKIIFSFDLTSYRIQSLGSDFQGIIEDEYTDILANPARINLVDKKQVQVKIANPPTVGLISNRRGLFVEGYESLRQGERLSFYSYPNYGYASVDSRKYKTQNEQVDFVFLKSINKGKISSGIGFFGARNIYINDYIYQWERVYSILTDNKIIGEEKYENKYKTTTENISGKLLFGFYKNGNFGTRELIANLTIAYPKSSNENYAYSYSNEDTDGDGYTYYDGSIPTPYYNWNLTKTNSNSEPKIIKLGAGLEYRSKAKTEDGQDGIIIGCSYQPTGLKINNNYESRSYSVRGTTITESVSISSATILSGGNKYSLILGWGRVTKFLEKRLSFMYACRGNFGYEYEETEQSSQEYLLVVSLTEKSKQFTGRIAVPIAMEYLLYKFLPLRVGFTYSINGSLKDEDVLTLGKKYFLQNRNVNINTEYRAGFGIIIKKVTLDFLLSGNIFYIPSYRMQLKYIF